MTSRAVAHVNQSLEAIGAVVHFTVRDMLVNLQVLFRHNLDNVHSSFQHVSVTCALAIFLHPGAQVVAAGDTVCRDTCALPDILVNLRVRV